MESRTQGSRPRPRTPKNPRPRPRTAFPRTGTLEAKDRNARGQGQGPRTQDQVLSKKKRKRSSQKFFKRSRQKNVFQKIFQALHKILTIQKIVLSSSRGQANFRGLEASRPRPRTSKCVLEAKDVLEDSTSAVWHKMSVFFLEKFSCAFRANSCFRYHKYYPTLHEDKVKIFAIFLL